MKKLTGSILIGLTVTVAALSSPAVASGQTGYGQSFMAPTVGSTLLSSITAARLFGSGGPAANPFLAQIYKFNGTSTVGSALFSQSLGSAFSGLTVAPNLVLTAGDSYLLIASAPSVFTGYGVTVAGVNYVVGAAQQCTAGACQSPFGNDQDVAGFSVDFGNVVALVTPEPGTWALCATGLLAVAFASRRRNRRIV